ncbi:hypothetical protein Agub_g6922, partial [Astrephomene gubernaculifera]
PLQPHQKEQQQQQQQQQHPSPGLAPCGPQHWYLVMDARDWKVIPAENLVALTLEYQLTRQHPRQPPQRSHQRSHQPPPPPPPLRLLATAGNAAEARLMLGALQGGTAGVLLRSEEAEEVLSLASYVRERAAQEAAATPPQPRAPPSPPSSSSSTSPTSSAAPLAIPAATQPQPPPPAPPPAPDVLPTTSAVPNTVPGTALQPPPSSNLSYTTPAAPAAAAPVLLPYEAAVVTRVEALGMGERVCVDLAEMMQPGEGLLVGSFARCLALVQCEAEQSAYIASRPFRVNAGPVHSYVAVAAGRTRYLAELASGCEV